MQPFLPPHSFTAERKTEALAAYNLLPVLTAVEEQLIALYMPVMRIYRLRGGALGYEGSVASIPQDITGLVSAVITSLPRLPTQLPIIIVRRVSTAEDYVDFRVRRAHVRKWLIFLIRYNKYYEDIVVDEASLNALPSDGSVYKDLSFEMEAEVGDGGNDDNASNPEDPMGEYVGLSRITDVANLAMVAVPLDKLKRDPDKCPSLKMRLKEEERLVMLAETTSHYYTNETAEFDIARLRNRGELLPPFAQRTRE
jgi:hypothetical protein